MTQKLERRTIPIDELSLEVRAKDDDKEPVIQGYAAVFDAKTFIPTFFGGFTESIKKGAFERAITKKQNVRSLFNHDPNQVLGTTKSGSLTLREDEKGLWTETTPSLDTSVARDVTEWIRRGEVTGMSFAFSITKQEWTRGDPKKGTSDHREILDVDLYDVGPVTFPAYEQTSVGLRESADELHKEVRSAWEAEVVPEPRPSGTDPAAVLWRVAILKKRHAA